MRSGTKRALLLLMMIVASIGCDHASKGIALAVLDEHPVSLAGDVIRFELAWNGGGFLSMGEHLSEPVRTLVFLAAVPLMLLVLSLHYGLRSRRAEASLLLLLGLGLTVGGGLANWLDRVLHAGFVTDFLIVGIAPLRTGIFNLADVAIVAGLAAILFSELREPVAEP